jgi:monoamine oxidase
VIHQPHQNNGHPLLQQSYLNGKLYFGGTDGGTETANESPGYMEGAVVAAKKLALQLEPENY